MKLHLALLMMTIGGMAAAAESRGDIEAVFDRNKGQLYSEYTRALREHPGLKGKVVLELDIGKAGDVTACRVQSTTMGNSDLPGKLCDRVLLWKFQPRSSPGTITKPLDFYPAG